MESIKKMQLKIGFIGHLFMVEFIIVNIWIILLEPFPGLCFLQWNLIFQQISKDLLIKVTQFKYSYWRTSEFKWPLHLISRSFWVKWWKCTTSIAFQIELEISDGKCQRAKRSSATLHYLLQRLL